VDKRGFVDIGFIDSVIPGEFKRVPPQAYRRPPLQSTQEPMSRFDVARLPFPC